MGKASISSDDVLRFLVDKATEDHKFTSVKDVSTEFGISTVKSREILRSLRGEGKVTPVYESPHIEIYAPKELIEHIERCVSKPEWIRNYALPNKEEHRKEMEKLEKALFEYERFEELLYLKNEPLEEPVAFTFEWLGFTVKRLPKGSFADCELERNGFIAAVEVAGGNAGCPIGEVRQLVDYFHQTLSEQKREIPHLLVLFNHFNATDLKERKKAFAPEVEKAAKRSNIVLATTLQLYEIVRQVKSGRKTKDEVVHEITEGKWSA